MRNYYSLRLGATIYKVLAWGVLGVEVFVIIASISNDLTKPYSALILAGSIILTFLLFMGFMFLAQSIMLMVNVANDVETITNNSLESQSIEYQKQSLKNQKEIITLLSSLDKDKNTSTKSIINTDDI